MKVLGVCSRLSEKSGLDRGLIQFLFILSLFIIGGTAVIVYLLAHFLMD